HCAWHLLTASSHNLENARPVKLNTSSKIIQLEPIAGPPIPVLGPVSIGRSRANNLVLGCSEVSRRHAIIRREGDARCLLMDLGSSNGTYVNGKRVVHSHELAD